jgi:hypothetical protein
MAESYTFSLKIGRYNRQARHITGRITAKCSNDKDLRGFRWLS